MHNGGRLLFHLPVAPAFFVAGAAEARAVPVVAGTDSNRLVVFDSSAPGGILATLNVTGLQVGETILGIDFRPATGQLYAPGSTGRLYVVNPSKGAAVLVGNVGGGEFIRDIAVAPQARSSSARGATA